MNTIQNMLEIIWQRKEKEAVVRTLKKYKSISFWNELQIKSTFISIALFHLVNNKY